MANHVVSVPIVALAKVHDVVVVIMRLHILVGCRALEEVIGALVWVLLLAEIFVIVVGREKMDDGRNRLELEVRIGPPAAIGQMGRVYQL